MTKKNFWLPVFVLLIIFTVIACISVPITGRKQLNLLPESQINSLSFDEYKKFIKSHKISKNKSKSKLVKKIGKKLQKAVVSFLKENGYFNHIKNYEWEFNLIKDKQANAFCMPGGKVVVYTGILPVAKDETGLAVVMGHEVAHAIANHGNERMSQNLVTGLGMQVLSKALEKYPEKTKNMFLISCGLATQAGVLLPYSRMHESEADRLGLIFMSIAGYNPNSVIGFWKRMSKNTKGVKLPEFISTHPSGSSRIKNIKKYLPEALKHYKK